MRFEVHSKVFEGPLDLLLQLAKSSEVDIFEISLSELIDDYLRYVEQGSGFNLQDGTEFLLIAAILVELKSQRLVPADEELVEDDEIDAWEARDLVLSQLLECQVYAAAGQLLEARAELAAMSVARSPGTDDAYLASLPDPLEGVTKASLLDAYARVLERVGEKRIEPKVETEHIIADIVTVDEAISDLVVTLPHAGVITFAELAARLATRIEIIVNFLALLELFKRGMVVLEQGITFGELRVQWVGAYEVLEEMSW